MDSSSLWGWLILLLFAGVFYGTYRYAKRDEVDVQPAEPVAGVGGWLLLLVVALLVLGPVIGAGRLFAGLASVEAEYPGLVTLESWATFKSAAWWSFLGTAGLSVYAGVGLAKGRNMSVVRRAKVLLWVIGPVASLVTGLVVPFLVFGDLELDPELLSEFVGSAVMAGIWTAYLAKSKRVLATYGGDRPAT